MAAVLVEVFSQALNVSADDLSDNSSPDNTPEWDSLAAMHLVSELEDAYSVELSTRDIMKMRSISIVRDVLRSKGVTNV